MTKKFFDISFSKKEVLKNVHIDGGGFTVVLTKDRAVIRRNGAITIYTTGNEIATQAYLFYKGFIEAYELYMACKTNTEKDHEEMGKYISLAQAPIYSDSYFSIGDYGIEMINIHINKLNEMVKAKMESEGIEMPEEDTSKNAEFQKNVEMADKL